MHRSQLHTDSYTQSPLVGLEILLAFYAIVSGLAVFVALWVFIFRRMSAYVVPAAVSPFVALFLVVASFIIDSPTLLYAT